MGPPAAASRAAVHHHAGPQQHPDPEKGPLLPPAKQGQPRPAGPDVSIPRSKLSRDGCTPDLFLGIAMGLVAACSFVMALSLAMDGYRAAWGQAVAMRTWPPAPAVVTVATNVTAALEQQSAKIYTVSFTYAVAGERYTGSALTYADLMLSTAWGYEDNRYHSSHTVVAMLAAGEPMTAYYDPAAAPPGSRAFLLRDVDTAPYLEMSLGMMMGMGGILALAFFQAIREVEDIGRNRFGEWLQDGTSITARFLMRHCRALLLPLTPLAWRVLRTVMPATVVAVWGSVVLSVLHLYVASGGAITSDNGLFLAFLYLVSGVGGCGAAAMLWFQLQECEEASPGWGEWAAAAGERAATGKAGRRQGEGCSGLELA